MKATLPANSLSPAAAGERVELIAEIAVPLPIQGTFSYRIPPELASKTKVGVRVRIPFKNREMTGYLVATKEVKVQEGLKPVSEFLDEEAVLSASMLELTHWISRYYGCGWGEAIENALPRWVRYGKRAERGLKKEGGILAPAEGARLEEFRLSRDQQKATEVIGRSLEEENPKPILLHGITGSGKSEIYIRAIRIVLSRGASAICLVPEIALTEQLRRFFLQHFGSDLEILHSKLSEGERFRAWRQLQQGEKKVVLGPRSAVFAPVSRLGILILDEEHEGSYKQETSPRYHAREVARWRARHENALLLMGSATPSLETMHQAERGEVTRLDLASRIDQRELPKVEILDLSELVSRERRMVILTGRMASEVQQNLARKEGTLLLLNRRGFSTAVHCPHCGKPESCPSCHVSLTFHQEDVRLLCHYCNFSKAAPEGCSSCKAPVLKFSGFGTEKVESEVARRFPHARIARLDADSVRRKGSHERILADFRQQKIDILIGTQMIAKGFDFPHVTLVGVIFADTGLVLPDFRSAERTFQLLTQVAGRAGRGSKPGRVIIQTLSPDHPSIRFAKDHDYASFYRHETRERAEYGYPPWRRLLNLIIRSRNEKKAHQFARGVHDRLREEWRSLFEQAPPENIEMMGPSPLPFYRLRGHFRWHLMLKIPPHLDITDPLAAFLVKQRKPSGVAYALDVDPLNIL